MTKRVICSGCNERFGGTIDDAVAKQVAFLRNQLQLESGTGKAPPGLGRMRAGNETIRINSNGAPELVGKPFTVTLMGEGRFNLEIGVHSPEELASVIPHIAAQVKTTEENIRTQVKASTARLISRRVGTVHQSMPLGGKLECRSLLKSCLVLWTTQVGNSEVRSAPYQAARDHVFYAAEDETNQSTSPYETVRLDSRQLPHISVLNERYGEFFNLIYVRSDASGRVIGHFTLYNIVSWHFVLAESGGTPNKKIALVSNPLNPSAWSRTIADEIDIEMAWLDSPDFDVSRSRDRVAAVLTKSREDGMEREINRIFGIALQTHGYALADLTNPGKLKLIIGEVSIRLAYHLANVPYVEYMSGEALLARATGANQTTT